MPAKSPLPNKVTFIGSRIWIWLYLAEGIIQTTTPFMEIEEIVGKAGGGQKGRMYIIFLLPDRRPDYSLSC